MKKIKIIPLGGLGEVGRNMTVFEYNNRILLIDAGFGFPNENTPGIDYVLPNTNYLRKRKKKIMGIVLTHAHYDHIGAIPYILDRLGNPPLYASDITREIVLQREDEHPHQSTAHIHKVKDGSKIKLPPFEVEFFHQCHNIPGSFGLVIKTPVGRIIHTGDFKFDKTPVNDKPTNFKKLKEIGKEDVLLLMSDSTDAEKEGHSLSEKKIAESLKKIFEESEQKIIIASFSSLINRLQQAISYAEEFGRKILIAGRSMQKNIEIARDLGYIKVKPESLIKPQELKNYDDDEILVLCTGTQAEDRAALMRIANNNDRYINVREGDTVVFSSSVIPGKEDAVQRLKDKFYHQKLDVIHYDMMDVHAGGHAQQEELKEMIDIMKPEYFMPIHGYYSMLVRHKKLAIEKGVPKENIVIAENGQVIEATKKKIKTTDKKVASQKVLVDGLGIGDVGEIVLRDRKILAQDGIFVIIVTIDRKTKKITTSPDIISRGFIYLRQSKKLLSQVSNKLKSIVDSNIQQNQKINEKDLKGEIQEKISNFLFYKTKRHPMVLPVIIKV